MAIAALVLGLAACGADATDSPEVASLSETPTSVPGSAASAPRNREDAQEAALAFAECMREHGVDMPDPQFDSGGGRDAVAIEIPADEGDFEAAQEECGGLLGPASGSFTPPDPEEQARFEEAVLAYAACMREHGVDFPDPQIGNGMVQIGGEGMDPNDPDFAEADAACRDELPGAGPSVVAGEAGDADETGDGGEVTP